MSNPIYVAWEVKTLSHLQKLILVAIATFGSIQILPKTNEVELPRNIPYQFDPEIIADNCDCTINKVHQELERLDEEGICKITSPRSGVFPFGKE